MAISSETRIIGLGGNTSVVEKKSTIANSQQEPFTVREIRQIQQEQTTVYQETTIAPPTELIVGAQYTLTSLRGNAVSNFTLTTAGTGYSTGTMVATTGGTGYLFQVDITSVGGLGEISGITIADAGYKYSIGDVITITGGNADATLTVTQITEMDDFTNVGVPVESGDGYVFTALETTPNIWNLSRVKLNAQTFSTTAYVQPSVKSVRTVEISSAELLTLGSVGVEFLPAPGAGFYYDVSKIIFEFTYGSAAYSLVDNTLMLTLGNELGFIHRDLICGPINRTAVFTSNNPYFVPVDEYIYTQPLQTDMALTLTTDNGSDPELGDGTLRAIIEYEVRVFGK